MSLKKQYIKTKPVCKVTFILAKDIVTSANQVNLAGDFNNWDVETIPMKKAKSGEFTTTLELEKGKEYQFKYLIDGKEISKRKFRYSRVNSKSKLYPTKDNGYFWYLGVVPASVFYTAR